MSREARWKAASLRSGFGKQPISTLSTAPGIGFGSATRSATNNASHVSLSDEPTGAGATDHLSIVIFRLEGV